MIHFYQLQALSDRVQANTDKKIGYYWSGRTWATVNQYIFDKPMINLLFVNMNTGLIYKSTKSGKRSKTLSGSILDITSLDLS